MIHWQLLSPHPEMPWTMILPSMWALEVLDEI
jgi:hypothetical protein